MQSITKPKIIKEKSNRLARKCHKAELSPVPMKVTWALLVSVSKSCPFIAMPTNTVSVAKSSGRSEIVGERQRTVVELMYMPRLLPNLPNTHLTPPGP